ncbi:hypothetical protein NDI45_01945 [Leptolyngbya sp. GB1-A1]|uniref:hypothetical protein n=1 Tax=Leptolyngbya sp. GB1-A1 TaxID=2933908 RepID=UPI0032995417
MQVEDERKIVFNAFLIVVFNLVVACFGIALFAWYYTPGNPIRPNRVDINLVGFTGIFIGVSQALYLTPLLIYAARSRKWDLVKGAALGGSVTALLNVVLLLILSEG